MFRPPPGSTLFPYTTLFRSRVGHEHDIARRGDRLRHIGKPLLGAERGDDLRLGIEFHAEAPLVIDRKSTRLNSSHTVISYAVFCLKKKKNISNHTNIRLQIF